MPISFELTFTQPVLAVLDSGRARGSSDMARIITQNYVRTMLTGIPGGGTVPPVLPAPGLGTPPPPFPIPAIPINNFAGRQRAMQRILKTYFEAREILIMQGDIKSTIKSITLLVKKAKVLRDQINSLIVQAADVQRQLLELPETLMALKNALIDVIRYERDQLELLFKGLDKFKLTLSASAFQNTFSDELLMIETIRNFKITLNPNDYRTLYKILSDLEYRLDQIPDEQDGSDEQIFKKYLAKQIRASLSVIVNLSNVLVDPTNYLTYVQDLANIDAKLQPVLDILYRYSFIRSKLEPQIVKLRRKIQALIDRLVDKVNTKIAEQKEKLKQKLKALAEKQAGPGKISLYAKAGKILSDFKKKYKVKIKKLRRNVQEVTAIATTAQGIIVRVSQLRSDIDAFANRGLKAYLDEFAIGLKEASMPESSSAFVDREIERILTQNGIKNRKIIDYIKMQLVGKISSPTTLLDYLEYRSEEIRNVYRNFISIIQDVSDLEARIRALIENKQTYAERGIPIQDYQQPTVSDVLVNILLELDNRLSIAQKKIVDFVNKQIQKVEETVKRIADDAKMKLIMLVPIKSDLKDKMTKAELVKAKKDKIKNTKDKIKRAILIAKILSSKVIPGALTVSQNLYNKEWRYSKNQGPLNSLIEGVYDLKKLKAATNVERIQLDQTRNRITADIRDYYFGLELLVDLVAKISSEVSSSKFLLELGDKLKQNTVDVVAQGYLDFYDKIKLIPSLKNGKIQDIINFFSDREAFRVLDRSYLRTVLVGVENKYLVETTATLDQFSTNPLVQRLLPGLKPGQDSILALIVEQINKLAANIKAFLQKIYSVTVKPLIDKVNKKIDDLKSDIEAWLKEHVVKRALNLDLKLMSVAFNIATRAFWTGFSWITPNGVRYTCVSIGPFIPLMSKPDSGASALVRELSRNLNRQLIMMTGLVTPPTPTGIPPFPFTGYR